MAYVEVLKKVQTLRVTVMDIFKINCERLFYI